MFLKTHCLPLLIALILFLYCFWVYILDAFRTDFRQTNQPIYNYQSSRLFNHINELWIRPDQAYDLVLVAPRVVSVDDFGAKANGSDDSQAFLEAWNYACSSRSSQEAILVVPKNKIYRLKPIEFKGPCESALVFKIYGTIESTVDPSDYQTQGRRWLRFRKVQNLRVEGAKGMINGNGINWWQKSCKINKTLPCKEAPTAVTFKECRDLRIAGLRISNGQKVHLRFDKCFNVKAFNVLVTAPGNSPNTDGIHVLESYNIHIKNSVIRTGDDCISIGSGSRYVHASGIKCGPGHGISIGSLGGRNSSEYVSDVIVNKATLSGTTNGIRIKTWQGGSGYAKNIKFQNIMMHNVRNPIIIDQNYCDRGKPCPKEIQASAVQVSNVLYQNISGTSASNVAVKFHCSQSFPCQRIYLQDVALRPQLQEKDIAEASCANVGLSYLGNVSPHC